MSVDKSYCMSSYLMFRSIMDPDKVFKDGISPKRYPRPIASTPIKNSFELEKALADGVKSALNNGKAALALSGGIDSAILAHFMPRGSTAYTFKCVVPGVSVTDESYMASQYATECGLKHKVVEIYWKDFEEFAPLLMRKKGAPLHSIEIQIYKAALTAKADGFDSLIFGESADCLYGGFSGLLSKDWKIGEFIDRYSHILPYTVLKSFNMVVEPYYRHEKDGFALVHEFVGDVFLNESINSYFNASEAADIKAVMPFLDTYLAVPLDYDRVRRGENKYLVREVFQRLYPKFEVPPKIPMPRPMNEWLSEWEGPRRPEFWPNCAMDLTGDQKWLLYCLELFLNSLEG